MNQHFAEKQKAKLNAPAFQQFLSLILCPLHLYKSIRLLKKKKELTMSRPQKANPGGEQHLNYQTLPGREAIKKTVGVYGAAVPCYN